MTLAIDAWWPDGRFDAAAADPRVAEWPPSPGRLFAALRASGRAAADIAALEWLESQPPPVVYAAARPLSEHRMEAFVVVNAVKGGGGNLTHPGRTNGLRSRVGSHLAEDRVVFCWTAAEPDAQTAARLDRLASDVPYLGRSTSPVVLTVSRDAPPEAACWEPVPLGGGRQLAVPYPGLARELEDAHRTGARSWERYRYVDYALRPDQSSRPAAVERPAPSPYGPPLVLRLTDAGRVSAVAAGRVTPALRRAVMGLVGDPLPPAVHGHGADGRPHVAYLPLPDVGHRHADGHLLALGISAPADEPDVADLIARAVIGAEPDRPILSALMVPGMDHPLQLSFEPMAQFPRGARADRWASHSRTWATVTPMLLDRFPRRGLEPDQVVADCAVRAGYPSPIRVEVSTTPFVAGVPHLRPHQVPRKADDRRPYRHARLTFDLAIGGPVLLGALRHLGFGLCAPVGDESRSR